MALDWFWTAYLGVRALVLATARGDVVGGVSRAGSELASGHAPTRTIIGKCQRVIDVVRRLFACPTVRVVRNVVAGLAVGTPIPARGSPWVKAVAAALAFACVLTPRPAVAEFSVYTEERSDAFQCAFRSTRADECSVYYRITYLGSTYNDASVRRRSPSNLVKNLFTNDEEVGSLMIRHSVERRARNPQDPPKVLFKRSEMVANFTREQSSFLNDLLGSASSAYSWEGVLGYFDVVAWRPLSYWDNLHLEIAIAKSQQQTLMKIQDLELGETLERVGDITTRSLLLDEISSKIIHTFAGASESQITARMELSSDRLRAYQYLVFREDQAYRGAEFDLEKALDGSSREFGYALFEVDLKESIFIDGGLQLNEHLIVSYLDFAFSGGTGSGSMIDDWRGQITDYGAKPSNLVEGCERIRATMRERLDLVADDQLLVIGKLLNEKGYDPDRHTQDYAGCISSDEIERLRQVGLRMGSCENPRCRMIARFMGDWRHWAGEEDPVVFGDFTWSVDDRPKEDGKGLLSLRRAYGGKQWYGSWDYLGAEPSSDGGEYVEWRGVAAIRNRAKGCDMNAWLRFNFLVKGEDDDSDQVVTLTKMTIEFDPNAEGERKGKMEKPLEVDDWQKQHTECKTTTDGTTYLM